MAYEKNKFNIFLASILILVFLFGVELYSIAYEPAKQLNNKEVINSESTFNKLIDKFDVNSFLQLFGIVVGAFLVIVKMGRQNRNNIKLQRENFKEELKLALFKDIIKYINAAQNKLSSLYSMSIMIPIQFNNYRIQLSTGIKPKPVSIRSQSLLDLNGQTLSSLITVARTIEQHEIVKPGLSIFQTAISSAHHDIMNKCMVLHNILFPYLPFDVPDNLRQKLGTDVLVLGTPNEEQLKEIQKFSDDYTTAILDATSYLLDLIKELQNELLGGLFEYRIPARKPIDPKCKVITTNPENIEKLKNYFKEETDWGMQIIETASRVRDKINTELESKLNQKANGEKREYG